jgi:ribonucleotide reductase beta subunit family protein with ferritin-like domain
MIPIDIRSLSVKQMEQEILKLKLENEQLKKDKQEITQLYNELCESIAGIGV